MTNILRGKPSLGVLIGFGLVVMCLGPTVAKACEGSSEEKGVIVFSPKSPLIFAAEEKKPISAENTGEREVAVEGVSLNKENAFKIAKNGDKCTGKTLKKLRGSACSVEIEAKPFTEDESAKMTLITSIGNAEYEVKTE
jgi:hypothetical protein